MIIHLTGATLFKDSEYLILDVHGVGYKLFITSEVLSHTSEQQQLSLWTHLAVREQSMDLYGFQSREELVFFELLISISGVGPKSALGILSLADVPTLTHAIATNDTTYLTKVSGIGTKIAKKIILELSDKVGSVSVSSLPLPEDADAIDALITMGYNVSEAREALKTVPSDIPGAGDRLKYALKALAR